MPCPRWVLDGSLVYFPVTRQRFGTPRYTTGVMSYGYSRKPRGGPLDQVAMYQDPQGVVNGHPESQLRGL